MQDEHERGGRRKPATAQYGERRRPDPQGRPGYLRVDTVHHSDRDGEKGVYHINTVDAVTQWQIVGSVSQISERALVPVLKDLLFHRPCGFATEVVDERGKVRKRYDTYLTPFEKFQSLPQAKDFLKDGVAMADLEKMAHAHSDTEYAKLVQRCKIELFRSFPELGVLG